MPRVEVDFSIDAIDEAENEGDETQTHDDDLNSLMEENGEEMWNESEVNAFFNVGTNVPQVLASETDSDNEFNVHDGVSLGSGSISDLGESDNEDLDLSENRADGDQYEENTDTDDSDPIQY